MNRRPDYYTIFQSALMLLLGAILYLCIVRIMFGQDLKVHGDEWLEFTRPTGAPIYIKRSHIIGFSAVKGTDFEGISAPNAESVIFLGIEDLSLGTPFEQVRDEMLKKKK